MPEAEEARLLVHFVIPGHFNSRFLFHRGIRILLRSRYFNPARRQRNGETRVPGTDLPFQTIKEQQASPGCLGYPGYEPLPIDIRFIIASAIDLRLDSGRNSWRYIQVPIRMP